MQVVGEAENARDAIRVIGQAACDAVVDEEQHPGRTDPGDTVSSYRALILEKMNMSTNADLTRYALEHHLV